MIVMRKNEYSIDVIAKFYNDENTAMMIFGEKPFHFDGDDKTYRWHLECMYSHNEVIMYFLVYDEENKTYVTEKGTNKAIEISAKDILSSADYDKVVAMMMEYVGESN